MSATTVDTTYCEQVVRELDRDRWLACLFAPASHRPHLLALYAFHCEITRIRDLVSEPLPGEVRLQWWRDLLEGEARGNASGNPVAAALLGAIRRYRLPSAALLALVVVLYFHDREINAFAQAVWGPPGIAFWDG